MVAGADMVGQEAKALMPIGGEAEPFCITSLAICRSSLRASTSSIRWTEHLGVCLGWGQGRAG